MMGIETAIHKADLILALDAEGKPVELHHALRLVRELRDELLMTTSHEVVENSDCTAFVPLYFVRHPDGSFSPAAPQPVVATEIAAVPDALRHIASIAHCGGLACLTELEVLVAIRRLSRDVLDSSGKLKDALARVQAALAAAQEGKP